MDFIYSSDNTFINLYNKYYGQFNKIDNISKKDVINIINTKINMNFIAYCISLNKVNIVIELIKYLNIGVHDLLFKYKKNQSVLYYCVKYNHVKLVKYLFNNFNIYRSYVINKKENILLFCINNNNKKILNIF